MKFRGLTSIHFVVCLVMLLSVPAAGCRDTSSQGLEGIIEGFDHVFAQDHVAEIRVEPQGGFDVLLQAYLDDGVLDYAETAFWFDDESLEAVGLRIKGDVEAGKGEKKFKYNLKLNFNFFSGDRFNRIDKVHLGANSSDPSQMRESLASRMYRAMLVPASRTAYATVEADGTSLGLYSLIQAVDKQFLKEQFATEEGADDGNLYKCQPPGCSLIWKGDGKFSYYFPDCGVSDGCGLVLQTNEDVPASTDYADIIHFLDVLNNTPEEEFESAFAAIFHVDSFLRFVAVAVAISDYDSYLNSQDNFFLYSRPDTGQFVFIPWDHNRSYGDYPCKGAPDESGGGVQEPWCGTGSFPLLERVLAVESFKNQYLAYLQEVVDNWLTVSTHTQWVAELDALMRDRLAEDPNFAYDMDAYKDAISDNASNGNPMNILEFVQARRDYLLGEL